MRSLQPTWMLVLMLAAVGCGNTDATRRPAGQPADMGPTLAGLTSIEVTPAQQTLVIMGTVAAGSGYHAVGAFADGHHEDVTARVSFSVDDPALGSFDGAQFTSTTKRGGATRVVASSGQISGSAELTLRLAERVTDASGGALPADPSAHFGGKYDPHREPTLLYPNDGVLVPANMGKLEFHFRPGAGDTMYQLSFSNAVTDIRVYLRCTQPTAGGCIYTPSDALWGWLSATNRGGDPVKVFVRGTDDQGTAYGDSNPAAVSIAEDDIQGGIYYWTTSGGTAIMRYDFASQTQKTASKFIGTELSGGTCVGCHALSRDGQKLIAEAGGQFDGRLLLLDVAKVAPVAPFGSLPKSIFESWGPDGTSYVGVFDRGSAPDADYNLLLFDGQTGLRTGDIPGTGSAEHPADHPDWSADGQSIAYVQVGIPNTLQQMYRGAIEVVRRSGKGWSAPRTLVPAVDGKNHYYPAFSPDSSFIVYDESTCSSGNQGEDCNADSDPSARLYAIALSPGAQPIELSRLDAPGRADGGDQLTTSFPKWSPFIFHRARGDSTSRLEWVTFSSRRAFGLRPPPTSTDGTGQTVNGMLIWMAAIDPDRVAAGKDPSYPAFVLPFQDVTTSNHIAQWTTKVVPPIR